MKQSLASVGAKHGAAQQALQPPLVIWLDSSCCAALVQHSLVTAPPAALACGIPP
jgi:hypothetical protein